MTPKEKAQELIEKFGTYAVIWSGGIEVERQNVKQCALIAVDEILQEIRYNKKIDWFIERRNGEEYITYWLEVKQEIEKL